MVLQQKLNNVIRGYQPPTIPRGPRSTRGIRSVRRNVDRNRMYAFDLLATVAGRLLAENNYCSKPDTIAFENSELVSSKNIIKAEWQDEDRQIDDESRSQIECIERGASSGIGYHRPFQICSLRESSQSQSQSQSYSSLSFNLVSDVDKSEVSAKEDLINMSTGEIECSLATLHGKYRCQECCHASADHTEAKSDGGIETPQLAECQRPWNGISRSNPDISSMGNSLDVGSHTSDAIGSDGRFEIPSPGEVIPGNSFPKNWNGMCHVYRDDDENFFGCTGPGTIAFKASRPQLVGNRRIRKLLAPKFWKVSPTLFSDRHLFHKHAQVKPKNMRYLRQRTPRSFFSRRKLFVGSSILKPNGVYSRQSISKTLEKGHKDQIKGSVLFSREENKASTFNQGQNPPFKSNNCQVKISIKSFRVPELLIKIPETATVASLKRTVLEAVSAILENGHHVDILRHGENIRDDSKTLVQAGLSSHGQMVDDLRFILESDASHVPALLSGQKNSSSLGHCDSSIKLSRLPAIPNSDQDVPAAKSNSPRPSADAPSVDCSQDCKTLAISSTDNSVLHGETPNLNPLGLVEIRPKGVETSVKKSRQSELVHRRIRRPFSVAEVEALVQAVEELGTGRWRDVKLRAFEDAHHRTYVDLKDKWKTLVHTARISPQQRRGEPVPQELLDRVLSAHGHWSQQQPESSG